MASTWTLRDVRQYLAYSNEASVDLTNAYAQITGKAIRADVLQEAKNFLYSNSTLSDFRAVIALSNDALPAFADNNTNAIVNVADGGQTAQDFISEICKGLILKEFPGQFLNMSIDETKNIARTGDASARKACKLLNDNRFRK